MTNDNIITIPYTKIREYEKQGLTWDEMQKKEKKAEKKRNEQLAIFLEKQKAKEVDHANKRKKKEENKRKDTRLQTLASARKEEERQEHKNSKRINDINKRMDSLKKAIDTYEKIKDTLDEEEEKELEKLVSLYGAYSNELVSLQLGRDHELKSIINNTNTFHELLEMYQQSDKNDVFNLYPLGSAVAQSGLKKYYDSNRKRQNYKSYTVEPSGKNKSQSIWTEEAKEGKESKPYEIYDTSKNGCNKRIQKLKLDIVRDNKKIDLQTTVGAYAELKYNSKGDLKRVITDKNIDNAIYYNASEPLGDGLDIVHTAIVQILEERQLQEQQGEEIDLEKPYTKRVVNADVWIKEKPTFKDIETSAIQECFKVCNQYVYKNKSLQVDPNQKFSYFSEMVTDEKTGVEEIVYKRSAKYRLDTTGNISRIDSDYNKLVESLDLTPKQAQVLALAEKGYNTPSIATYLKLNRSTVAERFSQIQTKAIKRWNTDILNTCVKIQERNVKAYYNNRITKLREKTKIEIGLIKNSGEMSDTTKKQKMNALRNSFLKSARNEHKRYEQSVNKIKEQQASINDRLRDEIEKKCAHFDNTYYIDK